MNREGGAILSRIFRRLLPGPLGEEARADLEKAHRERRGTTGAAWAWLWYAAHLLHPDTWWLVRGLRRVESRRRKADPGGVGQARSRLTVGVSWLDFKLAYRMLVKRPGLTFTAGLAVAFAVTLTASSFEFFTNVFYPTVPVDEPHEHVEIRSRDVRTMEFETLVLDDFESWRRACVPSSMSGRSRRFDERSGRRTALRGRSWGRR